MNEQYTYVRCLSINVLDLGKGSDPGFLDRRFICLKVCVGGGCLLC